MASSWADRERWYPWTAEVPEVGVPVAAHLGRLAELTPHRPTYVASTENRDGGYPFYRRCTTGGYGLISVERAQVCSERWFAQADEVVEAVVAGIVEQLAQQHELRHRRPGEDSRRQWFALAVEWLAALDPRWGEAERRRLEEILARNPFVDTRAVTDGGPPRSPGPR